MLASPNDGCDRMRMCSAMRMSVLNAKNRACC